MTDDDFESDGGPADEAGAGRRIDERRNDQAGREINALAKLRRAGLDPAVCNEEEAAAIAGVGPMMAATLCRQARRLASLGYIPD